MPRFPAAHLWLVLALAAAGVACASVILTHWLALNPCPLCIFQRLLLMLAAPLGLAAALLKGGGRRWLGAAVLVLLGLGAGMAGYQSWLQAGPEADVACMGGEPGPIERLVDWLGRQAPALFLATGFCDDPALSILGLSLANWSLAIFILLIGVGMLAMRASVGGHG